LGFESGNGTFLDTRKTQNSKLKTDLGLSLAW
jgi:hypothetical protein